MRKLSFVLTLTFLVVGLTGIAAASPALEIFNGNLEMNENSITNVGFLSVDTPLAAGNLSLGTGLTGDENGDIQIENGGVNGTHIEHGSETGQVLEWDDSKWAPATPDLTDISGSENTFTDVGEVSFGTNLSVTRGEEGNFVTVDVEDNWVNESGDSMSGNLDMDGNNITQAHMLNLTETEGDLPTCNADSGLNGSIMYNSSGHWGCNGTAWNSFY